MRVELNSRLSNNNVHAFRDCIYLLLSRVHVDRK